MNKIVNGLRRVRLTALCCVCAVSATAAGSAQAAPPAHGAHCIPGHGHFENRNTGPYGGFGYSGIGADYGVGIAGLWGFDLNGYDNQIPYFAAHPPVYYSGPIARPYGDSPYPYPPGLFAPAVAEGGPQMIINPYAQPSKTAPSTPAPSNAAPSNPLPEPPAPTNPPSKTVKPTAGHTASFIEPLSPSVEMLPSPEPAVIPDFAAIGLSRVHMVVNPYVK